MNATGVVGVLLAGGLARRMGGGDKPLMTLGGKRLLDRIIERARPQVDALIINANGNPARFAPYGLPVVADPVAGFAGPLAGVLAGMEWTRANRPDCLLIATFAADTPFFPRDVVANLLDVLDAGADIACAHSGGRNHPVFGLWPTALANDLRASLVEDGVRKVDVFTGKYRLRAVEFADHPFDPFFNVNRPEDLARAEEILLSAVEP
jgi:molybdopterin-guanine dinucleotide biosynthesis protein A